MIDILCIKNLQFINRGSQEVLKKICNKLELYKPLTMHIARHVFGNISGEKIPLKMLQKLYWHSSITTTIGYQSNFIHKDADDALEAVIGLLKNDSVRANY